MSSALLYALIVAGLTWLAVLTFWVWSLHHERSKLEKDVKDHLHWSLQAHASTIKSQKNVAEAMSTYNEALAQLGANNNLILAQIQELEQRLTAAEEQDL